MKKSNVIGMVLIALIMIWWMTSAPNRAPQQNKQQAKAMAQATQATASTGTLNIPGNDSGKISFGNSATLQPEPAKTESDTNSQASIASVADSSAVSEQAQQPAPPAVKPRDITIETDKFIVVLTNRGAKIKSVVVKTLADSTGKFPELIADTSAGALSLSFDGVNLDKALFTLSDSIADKISVEEPQTLSFVFTDDGGRKVIRSYSFTKDGESIQQKNYTEGFRPSRYALAWDGGMRETEAMPEGKTFGANYYFSEVVFNNTYGVEREMITSAQNFNEESGNVIWAGLRRKYVAMTLQFKNPGAAAIHAEPFGKKENPQDPGTFKISLSDAMRSDSLVYDFMILPLEWSKIKAFDVGYEKIIVSGWQWCGADVWFVAICGFLLWLLKAFYSIIPNYGVAIILLTILVRLITTPLTIKQLRSTRAMSQFKPELDAINVKYRSDPQRRQAAILEFYQKHHINPLASCTGGCLPLLLQMPIFFGLFMILGRAIELRDQPFFAWISDLSRSDVIWSGLHIPYIMPQGIAVLPIVMVFTTYFQTKQSMSAMTDPAQQKMMTWMMPAMMFFFSAVMPSGLVLYWIISNIWGIVQYRIMNPKAPQVENSKKATNVQDAKIIKKNK